MRSWLPLPLLVPFFALFATSAGTGPALLACGSSKVCSLLACQSAATVRMTATESAADHARATVTASRGDGTTAACASGRINNVPAAPGDRLPFNLSGSVDVKGVAGSPDATGGYLLEFAYNLEGAQPRAGDVYEVKVVVDNAAVAQLQERATYETSQPNGADCPPVCYNVTIDKTKK